MAKNNDATIEQIILIINILSCVKYCVLIIILNIWNNNQDIVKPITAPMSA